MASAHASLDAATTERKARLAKLKSLKRKQPTDSEDSDSNTHPSESTEDDGPSTSSMTNRYLSGRNYDPDTRGPKLGFENAPNADAETLEVRAAVLAKEAQENDERQRKEEKPIDLFSLQPKKPNWDLKRDLVRKMEVLNARTENAIARLVRERIEGQKRKEMENGNDRGDGATVGMDGVDLVQGVHVREREEEEEERTERQEDAQLT
ncbi:hypothetical protein MMC21_003041 [Puttea exsequens]|nr:hypothetical protein [Puttea exsequens]